MRNEFKGQRKISAVPGRKADSPIRRGRHGVDAAVRALRRYFVDAAKAQYLSYFTEVIRLLKKGGMLISDNVLQEGGIMESRFAVERRDRTILIE